MIVALAPQPSQSAGEMPAKSTELENASAGAFSAEIVRALNKDGQKEVISEEIASENNSETNDNNELSLFLSGCLFAMQTVKTESNATAGPSVLGQANGKSKTSLDIAASLKEEAATSAPAESLKSHKRIPGFKGKENLLTSALLSFQPAADLAAQNPAVPSNLSESGVKGSEKENTANKLDHAITALRPFADASALKQQETPKNEQAFAQPLVQNGENENTKRLGSILQTDSIPKIDSEHAAATAETRPTADSQYSNNRMTSGEEMFQKIGESNRNRIQPDAERQASGIGEARQQALFAMGNVSADRLMSTGKTTLLQDSKAPRDENTRANILEKIDNAGQKNSGELDTRVATVVRAASETAGMSDSRSEGENGNSAAMDMGGSRSDRTPARNEIPAWMTLQNKAESPIADSGKTKNSMSEYTQEKSIGMAAGFEASTGMNISTTGSNTSESSRPGELVYQIADRIQVQLRDGKNEIRIQLQPESLGSLEIRAEVTGNGVVARITAESAAVKNYLENNLHVLQQNLQDQGLKVERIQIAVQEVVNQQSASGQSAQFGHSASGGRQWSDNHKAPQASGDMLLNPAEEIVVDPLTLISSGSANRFHTVA